jgi:hypothetical protein
LHLLVLLLMNYWKIITLSLKQGKNPSVPRAVLSSDTTPLEIVIVGRMVQHFNVLGFDVDALGFDGTGFTR